MMYFLQEWDKKWNEINEMKYILFYVITTQISYYEISKKYFKINKQKKSNKKLIDSIHKLANLLIISE